MNIIVSLINKIIKKYLYKLKIENVNAEPIETIVSIN